MIWKSNNKAGLTELNEHMVVETIADVINLAILTIFGPNFVQMTQFAPQSVFGKTIYFPYAGRPIAISLILTKLNKLCTDFLTKYQLSMKKETQILA